MGSLTKWLAFIFTALTVTKYISGEKPDVPVQLRAMRGLTARLPCGRNNLYLDGPKSYAMWMRNDGKVVYRFPNEQSEKRALENIYNIPCDEGLCKEDTTLVIKKINDRHAGLYRCRIHFQGANSVDYLVELIVVDYLGIPEIYSSEGEHLKLGFAGPYAIGDPLTLICEVEDKDPNTDLTWRRNGEPIQGVYSVRDSGKLILEMTISPLTRADLFAYFVCLAQNADVTAPVANSVTLKMYLAPMSVQVRLNNNYDFEAGQPRVVDCVVVGSMPPPIISWYIGEKIVRASVHKELYDGNYTVSSLSLVASLDDDQKELRCKAYNSFFPDGDFDDRVTVNVGFRPHCQLGHNQKVGAVVRQTETVKCVVDSSPAPCVFTWTFPDNKSVVTNGMKVAGFVHRYSSSLTWQSYAGDKGLLLCRAANSYGEQKNPCVFNITSGGPPEQPVCNVRRIYPNSLRAQCNKRWDGGRPQTIQLDIIDETGTRIKTFSEESGRFFVPNVLDQENLTVVLYATNARGNSGVNTVYLHNLIPYSEAENSWLPYLEVTGILAACSTAAVIVAVVTKLMLERRGRPTDSGTSEDAVPPPPSPIAGVFYREPDIARGEPLIGTNITVNHLAGCHNQYSTTPLSACRLLNDRVPHPASFEPCSSGKHSYYV